MQNRRKQVALECDEGSERQCGNGGEWVHVEPALRQNSKSTLTSIVVGVTNCRPIALLTCYTPEHAITGTGHEPLGQLPLGVTDGAVAAATELANLLPLQPAPENGNAGSKQLSNSVH